MARMILVDGSNHAFRVHFALPPMHASDGFPTRALYGFTTMMARLERAWKPDYVAFCFDVGKTFRHEEFPDYKGHRPDMPADLRQQWPHFQALIEGFGYTYLGVKGVEADDVIGTLAKRFGGEDLEVLMVTGDKDYCQLVDDNIRILDLMKDAIIGPDEVPTKFGVGPERVIDVLGLAGDSSDNIPGVPGIGAKTAAKLIHEHGTLEQILEAAVDIKGKRGENLRLHGDDARLSKWLATIKLDVPLDLELEDLKPKGLQREALSALFEQWSFGKVAKRLLGQKSEVTLDGIRTISTVSDLKAFAEQCLKQGRVSFDTETNSLNPRQALLVGVSLSLPSGDTVYIPLRHDDGEQVEWDDFVSVFGPILADPSVEKVGQNLKYDIAVCAHNGLEVQGVAGDTMILDYVLAAHERRHGLDALSQRHLGHHMVSYAQVSDGERLLFNEIPLEDATIYAGEDALVARLVHEKLEGRLTDGQRYIYEQLELPLIPVLVQMEKAGVRLDQSRLEEVRVAISARLKTCEQLCHEIVGRAFKVSSTKALQGILFDELGYEPIKKTKTGFSTDSSVLEKLMGLRTPDLPAAVLEFRMLSKLLSTYLSKLPTYVASDGRIHTSLKQAVAATGRLASADPNLQNIPIRTVEGRKIRECFVPEDGHVFLSADYSQVELRVLAHCSNSETLREAFRGGEDIHRRTASEVFGVHPEEVTLELRSAAKAINFGLLYGMSAFRLAGDLSVSRAQAAKYMEDYFARMPEVEGWLSRIKEEARSAGFVTTLYGRRRILPAIGSQRFAERMGAEREAVNTVIQGTAADIIKRAMLRVHQAIKREGCAAKIVLQVHDELLLEVAEDQAERVQDLVRAEMEKAAELSVPLVVNTAIGHNWNEAHG